MDKKTINRLMIIAFEEADLVVEKGYSNRPFGAVLADKKGNIIAKAGNTTKRDNDITAHAEMNLLKKAFKKLKIVDLSEYIIVVNAEPCSMCATACIKAGIKEFYYSLPREKGCNPNLGLKEVVLKSKGKIIVEGGIYV